LEIPYFQAARFPTEREAGKVYFPIQQIIFAAKDACDLSAYRFRITEGWHVVVLGEQPPANLHQRIEALLTQGTLVNLQSTRPDVITWLQKRRGQAAKIAPWVEGHYDHPGKEQTT